MIKLATWNICLGLKNKKDYIYQVIYEEKIDICLLQETEILIDYPIELLSAKNFKIEPETTLTKARTAIIIRDGINYERKREIEKTDCGIVIIDVFANTNYRIINVYRQFNPPPQVLLNRNSSNPSWK